MYQPTCVHDYMYMCTNHAVCVQHRMYTYNYDYITCNVSTYMCTLLHVHVY